MLRCLPTITDPAVLISTSTADDAGVYRVADDLALVQSVDYFTAIVDDPYAFGAIAAANALSDIYAMGARPLTGLNIIGFPKKRLPMEVMYDILRGGADKATEAEVVIIGGHTIEDSEPKYGIAVTGVVHPDRIISNAGAQPGDSLVLTKPLGMGIITTALRIDKASDEVMAEAIAVMATLNRAASEAMIVAGAHACTDVTGYGLVGHLGEMTAASGVGAELSVEKIPVVEATWDLARQGIVSGGARRTEDFLGERVVWASAVPAEAQLIVCDAETSGGLLIAVAPDREASLVAALRGAATPAASVIGKISADPRHRIHVRH
ncbi:selenophosphate synthase [candidate division KD3-62 bacterium DG_56]|uniref:Selenide, water dikinase n=1 Tax=candidate division KD3-62 bacterium DG_56 TaxID=1704032 RepID=A0A0S7XQ43_9BACT|nr:MAG: selenophosphate synthase [candidate division KD3-62 bacterium DG_56]